MTDEPVSPLTPVSATPESATPESAAPESTAPESPAKPAPAHRAKKRSPWWLPLVVIMGAAPAVLALIIFGVIVRYSWAHDLDRCPYTLGTPRDLREGVAVREDHRQCMEDVEDHRWVVVREGMDDLPLGNLPLMGTNVTVEWAARLEEDHAIVDVTIPERGDLTFREPERNVGRE